MFKLITVLTLFFTLSIFKVGCSSATPNISVENPSTTAVFNPTQTALTTDPSPSLELGLPTEMVTANPSPDSTSSALSLYPYPDPYVSPGSELESYSFKTPIAGTVSIRGILVPTDPLVMLPANEDGIYLVPMPESESVVSIPQFEVGQVPQADVDERTGEFVFTNIQPGQYAIVVLTTTNLQTPARYFEGGSMAILQLTDDQIDETVDVGYLQIP